jgi:ribosomal protein S21
MGVEVRKKSGESASAVMYNFTKRIKRSGILKEARKRRFKKRVTSRLKRRLSAIHRATKKKDIERQKKLGLI